MQILLNGRLLDLSWRLYFQCRHTVQSVLEVPLKSLKRKKNGNWKIVGVGRVRFDIDKQTSLAFEKREKNWILICYSTFAAISSFQELVLLYVAHKLATGSRNMVSAAKITLFNLLWHFPLFPASRLFISMHRYFSVKFIRNNLRLTFSCFPA